VFEGRADTGYDHGFDAEVFYLGLALDPTYVEGFVTGCLERIGEDDPDGEHFLRDIWEEGDERDLVLEALKSGVEVRPGRPHRRSPDPAILLSSSCGSRMGSSWTFVARGLSDEDATVGIQPFAGAVGGLNAPLPGRSRR
jgi:hypothetical protein